MGLSVTFSKGQSLNVNEMYWTELISCSIAMIWYTLVVFYSHCTLIWRMFTEFPLNQLKANHVKEFTSLYCNVSLLCWVHFWVSTWNNFVIFLFISRTSIFFFNFLYRLFLHLLIYILVWWSEMSSFHVAARNACVQEMSIVPSCL